MTIYERLLLPENLNYAWNKAKRIYSMFDGYTDQAELADFELNLEERLGDIRQQFKKKRWRTRGLRPLPRPKKIQDNVAVDRQYYHVAVADQVAWIAVANSFGAELDQCMPSWSYGNRLYRPAWYEEGEDKQSRLEIGPYRHASGHLYRRFQHSWPLFRRHVALTATAMTRALAIDDTNLDEADRLALITAKKERLPYLAKDFWKGMPGSGHGTTLFRASIDLRQFYPTIQRTAVMSGLTFTQNLDGNMRRLLDDMLAFHLDASEISTAIERNVEPAYQEGPLTGIPTGLFVAGFLANAAMLPLDIEIHQRIMQKRNIAHFRFVDDHTILAYDFDDLCAWIDSYREVLRSYQIGPVVNSEKYDPASLSEWMTNRSIDSSVNGVGSQESGHSENDLRETAMRDTRIDGRNPTALLTKTLGQISAIAATNVHILDDDDLAERLKLLEWLLLANIPEGEIRGDTRASFAAGKIASLAPMLVREVSGLVEASRSLAELRARERHSDTLPPESSLQPIAREVETLEDELRISEERQLRHCFGLLLQAFRQYPAKPVLFYRMHQYCRITGFRGLKRIREWIGDIRSDGHRAWADYYLGLSHQLIARGVLLATRTYMLCDTLRSEKRAAIEFLHDVNNIEPSAFRVEHDSESWFHVMSRTELGVTLQAVAEVLSETPELQNLSRGLASLGERFCGVSFADTSEDWKDVTKYSPAIWAHMCESKLSVDNAYTAAWKRFLELFSFSDLAAIRAARRYPEFLPDSWWTQLLHSDNAVPKSDAGLLRDAMRGHEKRINEAHSSRKAAFTCAVRSLRLPPARWITLAEWTRFVGTELSTFDPRGSEWTALEVVRQIVSPIVESLKADESLLDRLHQDNVLLPATWKTQYQSDKMNSSVRWQDWQGFAKTTARAAVKVKIRSSETSVVDYRYFARSRGGRLLNDWEARLVGVGRLLLGQLRRNYDTPRIWNIRGNEQIIPIPKTGWFHAHSISSATLVLLECCLGRRVAETRTVKLYPELFGWTTGIEPNDTEFDPPMLMSSNELLQSIEHAQRALVDNQLSVAMNRPRQLIPFRIKDFAAGPYQAAEVDSTDE